MCQIAPMQRAIVKAIGAFAALVTVSAEAVAQRNGSDWDLPARGIDQQPGGGGYPQHLTEPAEASQLLRLVDVFLAKLKAK